VVQTSNDKLASLVTSYRNRPVEFIEGFLTHQGQSITLYDYQAQIANQTDLLSDAVTICKARQIGGSLIISLLAAYYLCCFPRTGIFIISKTVDQSGLIYVYIDKALRQSKVLRYLVDKANSTKDDLRLVNGSRVLFRSAGQLHADTLRGWSIGMIGNRGAVLFDEAQAIPSRAIDVADFASAGGHGVCLISTPGRPTGTFYDACRSPHYKHFHIPAKVCPRFTEKELKRWRATKKPSVVRTEIDALFSPGEENVFEPEDIEAAIDASLPRWGEPMRGDAKRNYHGSLDVSRIGNDRWVLTLGSIDKDGVMSVEGYQSWAGTQNPEYEDCVLTNNPDRIIADILGFHRHKGYHLVKLYVDVTSDPYFAHTLEKNLLPVEGIQWSAVKKERLITHLESCFRARRLKIPDSQIINSELLNYCYDLERMKDHEQRKLFLGGGDDDHLSSLAMLAQSITVKSKKGYSKLIWK